MSFAEKTKYLENMQDVAADKGLWNTAPPISLNRSFLDAKRCKTFSEVIVTEGSHQYVIGTRLSVDNGRITAIDSLVSDKGDWLFNANAYQKYSSQEDWSAPQTGKATMAGADQRRQQLPGPVLRQVRAHPVGQGRARGSKAAPTPIAKARPMRRGGRHPARRALHRQPRLHRR